MNQFFRNRATLSVNSERSGTEGARMARRPLNPGEDSIERSTVVDVLDKKGNKTGSKRLQWQIRLWNGELVRRVTTMKTTSKDDVKARAHVTAAELLGPKPEGKWKRSSRMSEYVRDVTIPAIEKNEADSQRKLRENSQARYVRVLELYAEQAEGFVIADAVRPSNLKAAFRCIALANGKTTATQAAKVVSRYVLGALVGEEVIEHNPLRDMRLNLPDKKGSTKPEGGRALTPEQRAAVKDYLLAYEAEKMPQPKRGRYSAEQRTAIRERAVDVTLVQAETGLRINEACSLTRADVDAQSDPLTLTVPEEVSKTHKGRTIPVMDERIADRIRERLAEVPQEPTALVYGSPAFPDRVWDASNRQKAAKALYREMADVLDIPLLREVSTHVWRATLNTEWMLRGIPDALRAAYLGHTPEMNRRSYTDTSSTAQLVALLREPKG